jgi:hypothetical protein
MVACARCIPVLRSIVSLPAGIADMPMPRFVLLTAFGSGLWNAAFIAAGWVLAEKWQQINQYTGPASTAIWIAVAIGLAYLAWRKLRGRITMIRAGPGPMQRGSGVRWMRCTSATAPHRHSHEKRMVPGHPNNH